MPLKTCRQWTVTPMMTLPPMTNYMLTEINKSEFVILSIRSPAHNSSSTPCVTGIAGPHCSVSEPCHVTMPCVLCLRQETDISSLELRYESLPGNECCAFNVYLIVLKLEIIFLIVCVCHDLYISSIWHELSYNVKSYGTSARKCNKASLWCVS